jgi:hypothetical protein
MGGSCDPRPHPQRHSSLCCASLGSAAPGGYCHAHVKATRSVKIVATYLSPIRPLVQEDLTNCLSEGLPVFMKGDFKEKHMDWNSGWPQQWVPSCATTPTGTAVSPTSQLRLTYNATPEVLDVMAVTDFVHWSIWLCGALRSDNPTVLIGSNRRSTFQKPNGPSQLNGNGLGYIPGTSWRQTPGEIRDKRQEGNRQARRRAD